MSQFIITEATQDDDATLREIMNENIIPGTVDLTFRRNPSYFDTCNIQGEDYKIFKCMVKETNEIIGVGGVYYFTSFINQEAMRVGYLADLRFAEKYQGTRAMFYGYRYFFKIHQQNPVPFYTTVIFTDNTSAISVISKGRAGLPIYGNMGKIHNAVIFLDFPKKQIIDKDIRIVKGTADMMKDVFSHIQQCYQEKQFAPSYQYEDLGTPRLLGLKPEDFYVAMKDSKIIGVTAIWDQSKFRQKYIEGYNAKFSFLKPVLKIGSYFLPIKALPNIGEELPFVTTSMVAIQDNDPAIFKILLRYIYNDIRKEKWQFILTGFHESDPLTEAFQDYNYTKVMGQFYCVHYPEDKVDLSLYKNRIPYQEIATI